MPTSSVLLPGGTTHGLVVILKGHHALYIARDHPQTSKLSSWSYHVNNICVCEITPGNKPISN